MTTGNRITMTDRPAAAMRHERKHRIHREEDRVLAERLGKLFAHDKHAGPDGTYRVTSLYFDTPYDSALREKINGVNRREKFRIRYYGKNTSFIRLEKKIKDRELCGKRSAPLEPEAVQRLINGEYGFLLESGNPLLTEFYSKIVGRGLRPRTVVSYEREAFFYEPGNVRITLDRDIRTGLGSTDFLRADMLLLPVTEGETILEVKYDAFLPDIVRMAVQVPGRQAQACSKYALCRRFD